MTNAPSSSTYTPKMLEDIIAALNEVKRTDGTIKFHDEILSTGTFSFSCPILQRPIHPAFNIMSNQQFALYVFEGAERLALISYVKIIAAITSNCFINTNVVKIPDRSMNVSRSVLKGLPRNAPAIDKNLKPALIPYSTVNFAHFLWNILPAIENAISAPKEIEIYIGSDPFNLRLKHPYADILIPVEQRRLRKCWSPHLLFMGGSSFFPDRVRRKLLSSIINEREPEDLKIYISVRPDIAHRYLINQVDFLCSLVSAFHEKYPDMEFVLDGFSMPEDIERPTYNDFFRSLYSKMIEKSRLAIREIADALPDSGIKINDITGLNLSSALETISSCSYYVCHAGTQQHKIAWLFPRNGFVHGVTTDSAAKWHAEHSECALVPSTFDSRIVDEVKFDEKSWHADSWFASLENHRGQYLISRKRKNNDYIITDINLAVSRIMDDYFEKVPGDAD